MKFKHILTPLVFGISANASVIADTIWQDVTTNSSDQSISQATASFNVNVAQARLLTANITQLSANMLNAQTINIINIPLPDGRIVQYQLEASEVMAPELAAKYPDIVTMRGHEVGNKSNAGHFDFTPHGFHAMFRHDNKIVFIDPKLRDNNNQYVSYYRKDANPLPGTDFKRLAPIVFPQTSVSSDSFNNALLPGSDNKLRTFRLAVAAAGEYTSFHGGTRAKAQAAIVTVINRVNFIYENDLAIHLTLVPNNDQLVYTNSATDPFSNTSRDISVVGGVIDRTIGNHNYDIGHVVSTRGGGLAGLGVVCGTSKASGVTGNPRPTGDPFSIDYVAHEMGHQFNGNHTFNGSTHSCRSNGSNFHSYEVGSGSTIMAYAGICGAENIQPNSDPFFHAHSIDEIVSYVTTGQGASCATVTNLHNTAPIASAGSDTVIPANTPFMLTGSASDANNDALTYSWEQMDLGGRTNNTAQMATDDGSRPLFRSWPASSNKTRYLPKLSDVLNNTLTIGEAYATTNRNLNFRLTVRDGNGGTFYDDKKITVKTMFGRFSLNQPTAGVKWIGNNSQVVHWDVAETDQPQFNCATVDIVLSTDAGGSFTQTLLARTANNGSASLIAPNITVTQARLMLKCSDNIFYAVSKANFTIAQGTGSAQAPVITTQNPVTTAEDTAVVISFNDLNVVDPDSSYPLGFTLTVRAGTNYTVSNTTITPGANYNGRLSVPVLVNDGQADSNVFTMDVEVTAVNDPPITLAGKDITGRVNTAVSLQGEVRDDGGFTTSTWSQLSGPGTTVFSNSSALNSTAVMNVVGTYILRLTATDGVFTSTDDVSVTITAGGNLNELHNGVPKTAISGTRRSEAFYTMTVPIGIKQLKFVTTGGIGDADLYVRFASKPTVNGYDCRSWNSTNEESCVINNIQAGTYHIMVRGYKPFTGVSLSGSYIP